MEWYGLRVILGGDALPFSYSNWLKQEKYMTPKLHSWKVDLKQIA